jgi:hypothetical protein
MIAKLAHENEVYRYPTGTEKPDLRTICNFKKGRKGLIEAAFKGTVTIAKTLGIPNLGDISTNGTKMKANASNRYTLSKERIEAIRRIMGQGMAIDKSHSTPIMVRTVVNFRFMLIYNHCHFCTLAFYNLFVGPFLYTIKIKSLTSLLLL